jgi:hypothetical protein
MQPYAEAGKSVLGLPAATGEFGGGALGSGLAGAAIMQAVENPHLAMYGLPIAGGMAGLYSRPVQQGANWLLRQPAGINPAMLAAPATPLASAIYGNWSGQ